MTKVIEKLQEKFGLRIERILSTGGGLPTVLDQVGEEDRIAAKLSDQVPVAIRSILMRFAAGSRHSSVRFIAEFMAE